MNLLMQYLLDSPVAPVQLEFVEKQDAISSHVHLTEITHTQKIFCINFESIPEEKMRSVPAILRNLLARQCTGEFDPERMEFIVNHCYQKELSAMENAAEETIAHAV
jgi:Zn-dependent M16 (insulinase) family peptidase